MEPGNLYFKDSFKTSFSLEVQICVVCGVLDHVWGLGFCCMTLFQPLILKPSSSLFISMVKMGIFFFFFLLEEVCMKGVIVQPSPLGYAQAGDRGRIPRVDVS